MKQDKQSRALNVILEASGALYGSEVTAMAIQQICRDPDVGATTTSAHKGWDVWAAAEKASVKLLDATDASLATHRLWKYVTSAGFRSRMLAYYQDDTDQYSKAASLRMFKRLARAFTQIVDDMEADDADQS
jgi:hypothetical protein